MCKLSAWLLIGLCGAVQSNTSSAATGLISFYKENHNIDIVINNFDKVSGSASIASGECGATENNEIPYANWIRRGSQIILEPYEFKRVGRHRVAKIVTGRFVLASVPYTLRGEPALKWIADKPLIGGSLVGYSFAGGGAVRLPKSPCPEDTIDSGVAWALAFPSKQNQLLTYFKDNKIDYDTYKTSHAGAPIPDYDNAFIINVPGGSEQIILKKLFDRGLIVEGYRPPAALSLGFTFVKMRKGQIADDKTTEEELKKKIITVIHDAFNGTLDADLISNGNHQFSLIVKKPIDTILRTKNYRDHWIFVRLNIIVDMLSDYDRIIVNEDNPRVLPWRDSEVPVEDAAFHLSCDGKGPYKNYSLVRKIREKIYEAASKLYSGTEISNGDCEE